MKLMILYNGSSSVYSLAPCNR